MEQQLKIVPPDILDGKTPLKTSSGQSGSRYFTVNFEETNQKTIYIKCDNGRVAAIRFKFNPEDKNDYILRRYNDYNDDCITQESSKESPYITLILDTMYVLSLHSPRIGLMYIDASSNIGLYE